MSKVPKRLMWLGVAVVLVAGLLVPRLELFGGGDGAGTAETPAEALEVAVQVVTPHLLAERFATVGTIQADERVEIRSELAGLLEDIRFREGTRVVRGELLVQIDDAAFVAERDRARHRVELARLREARQKDLLDEQLTSQDEYDLIASQLSVLEAELRVAEARLEKTQIRAPFSGVVGLRSVSRGAVLTPQIRITTLQKIDSVKLEFSVPENHATRVRPGETVGFRVKGSARRYEGEIYAVEPQVDRETRSLKARARCANPDGDLLPGAFADVELVVREIEDALTVPALAVIPELGSKKVFVIENDRAVARLVETGVRTATEVEITRGLAGGDRVIVSAIQRLSSGLPVREKPAETG
ncbi:MAG: efflux RND transporter periplasmic adaptor subunit [Acidobacteriota bacterium]|nr:efflux RND transporter periplasmic adaptor subunit [Acidobacteriota bacterium]